MKIYDENNVELVDPDLSLGYLIDDKLLIARHDAVEAVEEKGHWQIVAEYLNGGKEVVWIVDVPGVEAKEAWDEYEDILRYIPHTEEELARRDAIKNEPTPEQQIAELKEMIELLLSGVTE